MDAQRASPPAPARRGAPQPGGPGDAPRHVPLFAGLNVVAGGGGGGNGGVGGGASPPAPAHAAAPPPPDAAALTASVLARRGSRGPSLASLSFRRLALNLGP